MQFSRSLSPWVVFFSTAGLTQCLKTYSEGNLRSFFFTYNVLEKECEKVVFVFVLAQWKPA